MKIIRETTKYIKDLKRMAKQGKDLNLLIDIIEILVLEEKINLKYKDHPLRGNMSAYRELHITPDWLLVYKIEGDIIKLIRTGSHSDLF